MYSMCVSQDQRKYYELKKNVLNIAVYAQISGKLFAGQVVLRSQPVLSFDMLPFPKGYCLIQVWVSPISRPLGWLEVLDTSIRFIDWLHTFMFFILNIIIKEIYDLSLSRTAFLFLFIHLIISKNQESFSCSIKLHSWFFD